MAGDFDVFGELLLVHAKAGDRIERQVRWQVGAVGGHEIQDAPPSWQPRVEVGGQCPAYGLIEMDQ